ncbi:hypothetical protein HZA56_20020 [Candidatus Poribacteria bacterium]|nr:hypothetical protein [Candidatus Poribacteria bacterium]
MDLRELFNALYDKLLLRDVFGKVVPGGALIVCVLASLFGVDTLVHVLDKMTSVLWLEAVGSSWIVGFALQYLGETCCLLKTHPSGKKKSETRGIFCKKTYPSGEEKPETRPTFYEKWAQFHQIATPHERLHAERLNVIKEACGNAAISIVCGVSITLFGVRVRGAFSWYPLVPVSAVSLGLAFALWRMHVSHVERYGEFVKGTIGFREKMTRNTSVPSGVRRSQFAGLTRTSDKDLEMFDVRADLFFESPRNHIPSPRSYGVLYLLRRDICRCLERDHDTNVETSHVTLWPGGMAILAGIDLLGKFHEGDDESGQVGQRFRAFICKYFQPISAEEAETIYQLRNSLLHSFGLYSRTKSHEYRFILSASGVPLVQQMSAGCYQVDLLTLHGKFEDSVKQYAADLNADPMLQENFRKMFPCYGSIRIG